MSEAIQKRRRADRFTDWLAGLAVALVLAVVLAAAAEAMASLVGWVLGEADWHRGWLEARLKKSFDWLEGAPVIGVFASMLIDPKHGWLPGPGAWRDIFVLALALFAPCLWAGVRIGPALIARYDDEALRPTPPANLGLQWAGPLGAVQERVWAELEAWCRAGMGEGHTSLWRPWALPDVAERLSLALMVGENGGGKSHLAEAFARSLDRQQELAALAAASKGKAWRAQLTTKWNGLWWWRKRHPRQPWDCGYLVEDPAARLRLAQFRPRRPTLIIADELRDESLDSAFQALSAARADFRHPVRLLFVDVALPSVLALRFDSAAQRWHTPVHDLGAVPVIDFSEAHFRAAQFRALVGAQPPLAGEVRTSLMGRDAEWAPVTDALEQQPILVAEALRWVRQEKRRYEDLQPAADLPQLTGKMAAHQAERSTPELPADALGKRRELLRERVLRDRARHREARVRQTLGAQAGDGAYHALMVATVAGGGSAARLSRLLVLQSNALTQQRLEATFAQSLPADWVPPLKPAVVADELLRLHFDASPTLPLSQETKDRLRALIRRAWLLNPSGTRKSVARWHKRSHGDEFAAAMQALPTLAELQGSGEEAALRIEWVRAFVELAVLHGGDSAHARAALNLLRPDECRLAYDKLQAVLLHPDAGGVPALLLWLDLQRLAFPQAGTLAAAAAEALGIRLASEALHLLRQCVVVSVPVDRALETALDQAAFAALALLAELGDGLAGSTAFAEIAFELDRRVIGLDECGASSQPNRLRDRIRIGLLSALAQTTPDGAAVEASALRVLAALGRLEQAAAVPAVDTVWAGPTQDWELTRDLSGSAAESVAWALALWCRCHLQELAQAAEGAQRLGELARAFPNEAGVQHATAQAWRNLSWAHGDADAGAIAQAAGEAADIAARFEGHEGIQWEAAQAWSHLSLSCKDADARAATQAARKVADIAARFERHAGIQHEAALAWRLVAWAHRTTDVKATEQAVQKVADIAARFERHEGIQFEAAEAWRFLSIAHGRANVEASAQAAQKVAAIAARFARHERIQCSAAETLSLLAERHSDIDAQAVTQAVNQVGAIAARFEWHADIQKRAAAAWRHLSWAHKDTDAEATAHAAQQVADIAARFEGHEGIQQEAAEAWRNLAVAYRDTDAQATEQAAQKVTDIAARFSRHEGIGLDAASAWCALSSAHKDRDAQATRRAALKVDDIAARFRWHQAIQIDATAAWRNVAWAYQDIDAQAATQAAQRAADTAARFQGNEAIQLRAVEAWRIVCWAYRGTDARAAFQATQKVAEIAARFKRHRGIECEAARTWHIAILAAVKFDDEDVVARAERALDELARLGPSFILDARATVNGCVAEARQLAKVAADAWRANRRPAA
jgi:hypothetical protein